MNKQKINSLLKSWGQAQRRSNYNQNIKDSILNSLPVNNVATALSHTQTKRWWYPLAAVGFGVFCIVVTGSLLLSGSARKKSNQSANQQTSGKFANIYQMDSKDRYEIGSNVQENAIPPSPMLDASNSTPNLHGEIPITDTRQFLKTDYSATVRTRHTQETTGRIQTIIRGYDGRIDQISSSKQSGSITFVIPADKLESFKSELNQLVGVRFISEQISSQNLLSQKQTIEQNWDITQSSLNDLTVQQTELINTHDQTIKSLQSQLSVNNRKIANLQLELKTHPEQRSQIEPQINQAAKANDKVSYQIAQENGTHFTQLNSLNAQIETLQKNLENIDKQDIQLMDTVATVRGSIVVSSMNIWQWIGVYLPEYWPLYVTVIALVLVYILRRRRLKWDIENL